MSTEKRRKTTQINLRVPDELADQFDQYLESRGVSKTQFLENSIRKAIGYPLTIPADVLGVGEVEVLPQPANPVDEKLATLETGYHNLDVKLADVYHQLAELKTQLNYAGKLAA